MGLSLQSVPNQHSVMNIIKISLPLILSSLSVHLMIFVDRIFLVNYAVEAISAIAYTGVLTAVVSQGISGITSIAGVYSGQYNGAKKFKNVAVPVWQMVFFGLASIVITAPLSMIAHYAIPEVFYEHGEGFYRYLMFFAFVPAIFSAFAAFFIGIGNTKIVTIAMMIGNALNIFLDYLFIFGVDDLIPSMGAKGAAIGTVIAQFVQLAIIIVIFLNKKYNLIYNTRKALLDLVCMRKCIKLGVPNALGHLIELLALSMQVRIIGEYNAEFAIAFSIMQTIIILIYSIIDGLNKGVISIASNIIGAEQHYFINQLIKNTLKCFSLAVLIIGAIFIIFNKPILNLFIDKAELKNVSFDELKMMLFLVWVYFIFDGLSWTYASILTAGGDTKFLMVITAVSVWMLAIAPLYIASKFQLMSLYTAQYAAISFLIIHLVMLFFRYKSNKWLKLDINQQEA